MDTNQPVIRKFGTLMLDGEPVEPGTAYGSGKIDIGDTVPGKEITFIWIDVLGVYIADRNVLTNISSKQLEAQGLDAGSPILTTVTTIDGKTYLYRLMRTGMALRPNDNANEWAIAMLATNCDDGLWHWSGAYSWGQPIRPRDDMTPVVGGKDPRNWQFTMSSCQEPEMGFRPVLIPVN